MIDPTALRVTATIGREIASRAGPPGQTRRVKAKTGGRGSVRPERAGEGKRVASATSLSSLSLSCVALSLSLFLCLSLSSSFAFVAAAATAAFSFPASDHHSCSHWDGSVTTLFDTDWRSFFSSLFLAPLLLALGSLQVRHSR